MRVVVILLAVLVAAAVPVHADDVSALLQKGPLVRLETDAQGKLRGATCIVDVAASPEVVWKVLTDYERYIDYMPRMKDLEVRREGRDAYLAIKLDTPLVATNYTNKMTANDADHTIVARQVDGDLDGSTYHWRVVPVGSGTRIYYAGLIKNYSSLAERFEDEQQTITIGINVVSLLQTAKAVKERSEVVARRTGSAVPPAGP